MSSRISLPVSASWETIWASAARENGVAGEAHLFLEILETEDEITAMLLALSGVSREEARLYARSWLEESLPSVEKKIGYARGVSQVLQLASREAKLDKRPFIEPHHFFIACVCHRRESHLGEVLRPLGLDAARLRQHLRGIRASERPYPRGNPLNDLTEGAKRIIEAAHVEMRASYCGRISVAHLLLGILSDEETAAILQNAGCDLEELKKKTRDSIQNDGEIATPQKRFSPGAKRAIERAAREAKLSNQKFIGCKHLLLGLLPQVETMSEKWKARGQTLDSLDFLWNPAQVKALRFALGSSQRNTAVKNVENYSNSKSFRFRRAINVAFSFMVGLTWHYYLVLVFTRILEAHEAIFALLVLLLSALLVCMVAIWESSSQASAAFSAFLGWIIGMAVGFSGL